MSIYDAVVFFVVAHLDDWHLFMNPNVIKEVSNLNHKVVIVHTTGNDAGAGIVHWIGKEEAVISSIQFGITHLQRTKGIRDVVRINNHILHRWKNTNVVCYFLRIPDGNMDGSGFSNQSYQSLYKLHQQDIPSIRSVDQSTVYYGWKDFVDTIQGIIDFEVTKGSAISVHHPETDININPGDHLDHIITGKAIQDLPYIKLYDTYSYIGYHLLNYPEDLSGLDVFWKIGQFVMYDRTFYELSNYSIIKEGNSAYINFCLRSPRFRKQ